MKKRILLGALLLALVAAPAAVPDDPLRVADVIRFLKAGISERTILLEIRDRGVGEPLDAAGETALREAGGTTAIVEALRAAAPQPPPKPAVPPPAGKAEKSRAPAGPVFGVTTRTVRLPVAVTDKKGHPLTDLTEANFRVLEEGRPQPITFFSGERKPLRIALALDISGSMDRKIGEVADALAYFLELLEPQDQILVLTFSGSTDVVQDFTSDRDLLARVFARLHPRGGTALYDAVVEGTRRLSGLPAESKAIVLVTDGMDTASVASFETAREAARQAEVPVYSIGIGDDSGMRFLLRGLGGIQMGPFGRGRGGRGGYPPQGWPAERDLDSRPLIELADETGGRAEILKGLKPAAPGKPNRLKEAAESIALSLRHRYLLAYEPPEDGERRGWRKIKVEVDRPAAKVQARKGYYATS